MNTAHIRRIHFAKAIGALCAATLVACTSDVTSTPGPDAEESRIATALAAIPTAALVRTATPESGATPQSTATSIGPAQATLPPEPTDTTTASELPTLAPGQEYTVQAGDTLSTLAARFNTSMAALQRINNLGDSQTVRLGQKLSIPSGRLAEDEGVYWFIYIVKSGDSSSVIAARFGVTVQDLLRVNGISDASRVLIGQPLIIPVKTPKPAADAAPAKPEAQLVAPTAAPQAPLPTVGPPVLQPVEVAEALRIPTQSPIPVVPLATPAPINGPVTQGDSSSAAVVSAPAEGAEGMRAVLLALYNRERVAAGLPPLRASALLQASAQAHADECAASGTGSHIGQDGSRPRDRMLRAGFAGRFTGENWAWGRTAERAFEMWFTEETPDGPHRKNIMSPNYSEVGFGIGQARGGYFFIANLGG